MSKKNRWKKISSLFLALVLLLSVLPVEPVEAGTNVHWNNSLYDYQSEVGYSLAVEKSVGTLNIGDYLELSRYGSVSDAEMSNAYKATYSSSNTKVATVNKNSGKVTIVATGSTILKITVNGNLYNCELKVISDTSLGKKGRAMDARLAKLAAKKITASNRGSYLTEMNAILKTAKAAGLYVDTTYGNPLECFKDETRANNICYITKYAMYDDIEDTLRSYQDSARTHYMRSASATKKTKKVKITYSGALTYSDIYGMTNPNIGAVVAKNPASTKVRVSLIKNCNSNTNSTYQYATGTLTMKKGAKSGTVTVNKSLAAGKYTVYVYYNSNSAYVAALTVK